MPAERHGGEQLIMSLSPSSSSSFIPFLSFPSEVHLHVSEALQLPLQNPWSLPEGRGWGRKERKEE